MSRLPNTAGAAITTAEAGEFRKFDDLRGMEVEAKAGWVYMAASTNSRIQVFKPAGGISS